MRKIWVLGILFSAFAITGCFNSGSCVQGYGPVMIISRQPGHIVGWLFLTIGFFSALALLVYGSEELALEIFPQKIIEYIFWVGNGIWMPVFFLPITLVLQYFPDGRLPSPRWWPVTAATILGILATGVGFQFSPYPIEDPGILETV